MSERKTLMQSGGPRQGRKPNILLGINLLCSRNQTSRLFNMLSKSFLKQGASEMGRREEEFFFGMGITIKTFQEGGVEPERRKEL